MRRLVLFTAIMICMTCSAPLSQADQLKTGIMKTAPAPNQITGTPTPQAPSVKTAPGVTAPVPTKQGFTAPLGQKATIAVKNPAQGTRHPADKPLAIVWDRSAIATTATVNILLMDRPGGTVQAAIKTGAANTGSFMSWLPSAQFVVPGKSWVVRIETRDKKSQGYSGAFSFAKSNADRTESGLPLQNNQNPPTRPVAAQHLMQNDVSISKDVKMEKDDSSGINMDQIDIMQTQINILKRELENEKEARKNLEKIISEHILIYESHVHAYKFGLGRRISMSSKRNWNNVSDDQLIIYVDPNMEQANKENPITSAPE
ncbi:hypothetical protein H4684_002825 [Desulfomicrobium macestii]|uniref:AMIN domain-containing protein n=1 Tax=Desulfomicrobium macestii TaxID=90731 RepID=A0ABR9H6I1_9BACT|nr:hypothetical protein [Desulfomicrobium macestii]MBE1426163.1 hypothetical protein [Desulfomicrobium macestii]